jgi:replicative DNA helicase
MAKTIVLPSNVEAERSVLGAMLLDPNAAAVALASLSEASFSGVDKRNILVFRAMQELASRKTPIDAETVTNELIIMKTLEDAGGPEYLLELGNSPISPDNIDHYINIVRDQSVLRDFLLKMQEIQDAYAAGDVHDIGEFLAGSNAALDEIASHRTVADFKKADVISEAVRTQIQNISNRANRGLTGVDTGYLRLNKFTHGWQKGDFIAVAARPSVGKTAFALNLALHATNHKDKPVAFFSCEMGADQIMKRLIASVAHVNSENIQTGDLTQKDLEKVSSAIDAIRHTKLYIDDTANPLLGDVIAKTRKLKAAEPDLALVIIDYLNLIVTEQHYESRAQEVGQITRSLKELARNLHIPVIALAQLNRDVDQNEGHVPMLSNLKESGSIEQDADIALLMYRDDYYTSTGQGQPKLKGFANNDYSKNLASQVQAAQAQGAGKASDISVVTFSLAKNRNGRTGIFSLLFSKSYSLFDNPSEEMEQTQKKLAGLPTDEP